MPVDPRLLSQEPLARQHELVHRLLRRPLSTRQRSVLTLRHELIRVAMARRWGSQHFRDNHNTPVDHDDMSDRAQAALVLYERRALLPIHDDRDQQNFFDRLLSHF